MIVLQSSFCKHPPAGGENIRLARGVSSCASSNEDCVLAFVDASASGRNI
jgi:hypothetical protein